MGEGEGIDALDPERRQPQPDQPVILVVAVALEQAEVASPVDEPDGAVVADQQRPGHIGDGRAEGVAMAPYGQEQLMLGGGHPQPGRLLLAEAAEPPQGDPELEDPGELFVAQHAPTLRRLSRLDPVPGAVSPVGIVRAGLVGDDVGDGESGQALDPGPGVHP